VVHFYSATLVHFYSALDKSVNLPQAQAKKPASFIPHSKYQTFFPLSLHSIAKSRKLAKRKNSIRYWTLPVAQVRYC
jgi:hypothetical protein